MCYHSWLQKEFLVSLRTPILTFSGLHSCYRLAEMVDVKVSWNLKQFLSKVTFHRKGTF